jgi:hypothetical protein
MGRRWEVWIRTIGLLVAALSWSPVPAQTSSAPVPLSEILTTSTSCSARACHGSLRPVPLSNVDQVESTKWIMHDPHARAWDVLASERSLRIGRNLGLKNLPEREASCLACHSDPRTAQESPNSEILAQRMLGTGCESCHGSASQWRDEHTAPSWRSLPPPQKQARGMTPLGDPLAIAKTCVGCHVGAPTTAELPARDVNHDLIAAGHPRVVFEFGTFLEHLPRHWSEKRQQARGQDFDARAWLLGQAVVTQASLELLQSRARDQQAPWPEFAEYDCFACHHDLTGRARDAFTSKPDRVPGSLRWGAWSYAGARSSDAPADLKASLGLLGAMLERPMPPRQQVAELAGSALHDTNAWLLQANASSWNPAARRKRMTALASPQIIPRNWDACAQVYSGLAALAREPAQPALQPILDEMARTLAFPTDPIRGSGWDSPRQFDFAPFEEQRERIRKELERQK